MELLGPVKSAVKKRINNVIQGNNQVKGLEDRINDLEVKVEQLTDSLKLYANLLTPPPKKLQSRIVGGFFGDYMAGGFNNVKEFNQALALAGKSVADFTSVLDFGCGCGRVFLPLHQMYPHLAISGSDIDPEAIEYNTNNFGHIGNFKVNPFEGPSSFADNSFDLVYGISVFTHLPEEMQFKWLADLKRVTQPGAHLLLTIENEKTRVILNEEQKKIFDEKGFFFFEGWLTEGLPDFYRTTLHTYDYVRSNWSKYFEVVDFVAKGMGNHQDFVLLRNNK